MLSDNASLSSCKALLLNGKALLSSDKAHLLNDKALLLNDKALLSNDKTLLSNDKALLSSDKALLSNDKALLSSDKALLSSDKALLPSDKALLSSDKALLSSDIIAFNDLNFLQTFSKLRGNICFQSLVLQIKYLKMKKVLIIALALLTLSACAGKKKVKTAQQKTQEVKALLDRAKSDLNDCETKTINLQASLNAKDAQLAAKEDELQNRNKRINELQEQIDYLKKTNTNLLDRLSDLSVISKSGAESIRRSLDAINDQSRYIKNLNDNIQRKDSLNIALVTNLKRSLGNVYDEDVTIEVKKGVVYVSLSDKLLFKSGSAEISSAAEAVLGKIAKIVNDYQQLDILVEGHTDSVPISTSCMADNWDLSVKRSVSVIRMLQNRFGVAPGRMTAGGRSEFTPKTTNDTAEGRKLNRRTEIIITPKLDEFFELSVPK